MRIKALSFFIFLVLSGCSQSEHSKIYDVSLDAFVQQTGLAASTAAPVYMFDDTSDERPFSSGHHTVSAVADLTQKNQVFAGLTKAFSLYSRESYLPLIETVFIYESIYNQDAKSGGFYGPGYIALVAPQWADNKGLTYQAAIEAVHHELSSHVLLRYPLVGIDWGKLLPEGWEPAADGRTALRYKSNYTLDDGFVADYAATSMENDFNMMAEITLSEPARMRRLAAKHPIVAKKLYLLMSVYDEFDPKVKQFFDEQGLREVAIPVESSTISFKAPEGLFDHLSR